MVSFAAETNGATMIDDYSTATATEMAQALAAGEVSAVELAKAAIDRIEATDGAINAVVVRDFERGLETAKAADADLARGERRPLLGVPMTVKEAHNVAGLPTTWGAEIFKDWVAPTDSVGVARLKAAGAVILGKTNVPPFLSDWQSDNPIYGRTNNPIDLERTPGGSSGGGAAALAAGMVPLEFGSDIGGSIRVPAAFCGVVGHKPSHDIIPQRGHTPPGLDGRGVELGVIGPMARSVEDLERALDVLAGADEEEGVGWKLELPAARHDRLADFRVLVLDHHPVTTTDSDVKAAINAFAGRIEAAGAKVARESNRLPDLEAAFGAYLAILMPIMSRGAPDPGDIPNAHGWMTSLDVQLAFRRQWAALFGDFDVVVAPAFGVPAFKHIQGEFNARTLTIDGEVTPYMNQIGWPAVATFANLPATSIPVGRSKSGLPIGAQVIGPYLEDRTALAFARLAGAL
jgi:amidase